MKTLFSRRETLTGALAASASLWAGTSAAHHKTYVVPEEHMPRMVSVRKDFAPGEIHVDPFRYYLYWVTEEGKAIRYVIGVARKGLYRPGTYAIQRKAKWPSWRPTAAMIAREPGKYQRYADGMRGGPNNPLGARALYLYAGSRDTYLRIHGTPHPWTVMTSRSNGCVRLVNSHVEHLYDQVPVGTQVTLHG